MKIKAPQSPQEIINKEQSFPSIMWGKNNMIRSYANSLYRGKGIALVNTSRVSNYQTKAILIWNGSSIEVIATEITAHRASTLVQAIRDGSIKNVDPNVVANYVNNGYTTRLGLFRSWDKAQRCAKINESHVEITTWGKKWHDARVAYRS